jgi:transcriptional regulator of acetoin/glycerol metabolism
MLSDARMLGERDIVSALGPSRRHQAETPNPSVPAAHAPRAEAPVVTREAVEEALREVAGNRSAAARRLGLSRRAFYRRLESFGLQ